VSKAPQAKAANLYWDNDATAAGNNISTGAGLGGAGTWDISAAKWFDGTNDIAWSNSALDVAYFNGTAGAVTLGEAITVGGLNFGVTGYSLTGNTLTLSPPTGSVSPVIAVTNNGSGTNRATISSTLAGSRGLTKTGNGTLVLSADNSATLSGDIAIKGGTVSITNINQLGAAIGTTISITGISNTGNPGYSGGALVLQGSSVSATSSGITVGRELSIAGRGPGASNSSGAVISVGYNNLAGGLVISSGATDGTIWATHGITTVSGNVFLGSSIARFHGNGNFIASGLVTGTDASQDRLYKTGNMFTTTLWLQNNQNSFQQTLRIDGGTVRVSDNAALGLNTTARAVDYGATAILELHSDTPNYSSRNFYVRGGATGTVFASRSLGGSGVGQTFQLGNLSLENGTFNARGRNGAAIIINGSTGAGTNTSWGGTGNAAFTNDGSGLFTFNGNIRKDEGTTRDLAVAGNGDITITGNFLGAGAGVHQLSKRGTGIFILGGSAGTFTGRTAIQQGTLSVSSLGALNASSTAAIEIGGPGGTNLPAQTVTSTLKYTGVGESSARSFSLVGTTGGAIILSSGTGALTLSGNFSSTGTGAKTLTLGGSNEGNNAITGVINDNSGTHLTSVTKIGSGTWQLSGANTFTGITTVTNGTLKIQDTFSAGSRNVLPNAGQIIFNSHAFTNSAGGVFEYLGNGANASAETVGALVPTAGAGTVRVTAGAGGTAALTFASLGTVTAGSGINFITNAGASVAFTTAANTNGILNARFFFNGADFAAGPAVVAASYAAANTGASLAGGNTAPYHVTTADIVSQSTATINAGIKFSDTRSLTLGSGQTLTIQNGAATVSGAILVTGGSTVTIAGGSGVTTGGAADLVFRTDGAADVLNLNTPITATTTGGWTKLGAGTLTLGAVNAATNAGQVHINEGTVRLATAAASLGADSMDVRLRQGAILDLNGFSLGTAASGTRSIDELNGAGTVTNSAVSTVSVLRLGNGNGSSYFTGRINDGAGSTALVKSGTGSLRLTGAQDFTGGVTLVAGTMLVNELANFGTSSGLGRGILGNNAGSLVFNGGSLTYTGAEGTIFQESATPSVSIDREFTLAGAGRINSSGRFGSNNLDNNANNAALVFSSSNPISFSGTGTRSFTLGGDSTGDNELRLRLTNNTADPSPATTGALSLVKVYELAFGSWATPPIRITGRR
jgi:autotransporter-associated beta strand protein